MTKLYANPYNIDATGFYFESAEEFQDKADKLRDRFGNPVEEFEIDYIDGDDGPLFRACGIHQGDLSTWFDDVESLNDQQKAALYYLTDCNGYTLENALDTLDDVTMYEGTLLDAATELFNDCYLPEVPEAVQKYIDYDAFAHDCRIGGDMYEFDLSGTTWTVVNANEV